MNKIYENDVTPILEDNEKEFAAVALGLGKIYIPRQVAELAKAFEDTWMN